MALIFLILSIIPLKTSLYFLSNSLFLSTESKIIYLFPFISSIYPPAWVIRKYKGFALLIFLQSPIFLIVTYPIL